MCDSAPPWLQLAYWNARQRDVCSRLASIEWRAYRLSSFTSAAIILATPKRSRDMRPTCTYPGSDRSLTSPSITRSECSTPDMRHSENFRIRTNQRGLRRPRGAKRLPQKLAMLRRCLSYGNCPVECSYFLPWRRSSSDPIRSPVRLTGGLSVLRTEGWQVLRRTLRRLAAHR
jgi:hypothetical protein